MLLSSQGKSTAKDTFIRYVCIYILVATHFSSTLHSFSILSIFLYIVYLPVELSMSDGLI